MRHHIFFRGSWHNCSNHHGNQFLQPTQSWMEHPRFWHFNYLHGFPHQTGMNCFVGTKTTVGTQTMAPTTVKAYFFCQIWILRKVRYSTTPSKPAWNLRLLFDLCYLAYGTVGVVGGADLGVLWKVPLLHSRQRFRIRNVRKSTLINHGNWSVLWFKKTLIGLGRNRNQHVYDWRKWIPVERNSLPDAGTKKHRTSSIESLHLNVSSSQRSQCKSHLWVGPIICRYL